MEWTKEDAELLGQLVGEQYVKSKPVRPTSLKDGTITRFNFSPPTPCPLCKRVHKTNHWYVDKDALGQLRVGCFSQRADSGEKTGKRALSSSSSSSSSKEGARAKATPAFKTCFDPTQTFHLNMTTNQVVKQVSPSCFRLAGREAPPVEAISSTFVDFHPVPLDSLPFIPINSKTGTLFYVGVIGEAEEEKEEEMEDACFSD